MKNDFTHENFEDFLKRSADGLRMRPPDAVWEGLSGELSKRRRRFFFGLSAFLLVASTAGYFIIANVTETGQAVSHKTNTTPGNSAQAKDASGPQRSLSNRTAAPSVNAPATSNGSRTGTNELNSQRTPLRVAYRASQLDEVRQPASERTALGGEIEPSPGSTFSPTVVDSYTEFEQKEESSTQKPLLAASTGELPYSIESVLNAFRGKKKRFETQLYFTPTISYRKLTENKSYLRSLNAQAGNYLALNSSVNNNVTHKPDLGFELGFAAKYSISNRLKLRTGLQFNVNRYDVKAFMSQPTSATIALNNGLRVDSLNTLSRYSNVNGYKSDWLQNFSFQLSAPVGAEYLVAGSKKVQFGIGATVQPTYILGDRAYLITTDYKSYTQVPWLVRRWNVNTALETFVNIEGEKTRWQIGPQVRYQLLSSFISEYPVKENLFDFGLKVGVSLSK